ncbi:hypothetical protein KM043_003791 [Ampulex compressa]|nr:hypothetical protein KM043_003791 [Ampulex compressa]
MPRNRRNRRRWLSTGVPNRPANCGRQIRRGLLRRSFLERYPPPSPAEYSAVIEMHIYMRPKGVDASRTCIPADEKRRTDRPRGAPTRGWKKKKKKKKKRKRAEGWAFGGQRGRTTRKGDEARGAKEGRSKGK